MQILQLALSQWQISMVFMLSVCGCVFFLLHRFWELKISWFARKEIIHLSQRPLDKMAAIMADNIFTCIFLNENHKILIKISLKFVPRSLIGNKPVLVLVMAWRRTGDKPLPEPMLTQFTDTYMRH